mgnify:CR=1 FL=1
MYLKIIAGIGKNRLGGVLPLIIGNFAVPARSDRYATLDFIAKETIGLKAAEDVQAGHPEMSNIGDGQEHSILGKSDSCSLPIAKNCDVGLVRKLEIRR